VREYIKAALSPAKVSEIKLDREKMKAGVVVDDDQLSLSIGKHGQNVRLASRLVGWELDIRTKSMIAAEALGDTKALQVAVVPEAQVDKDEEPKIKKVKKVVTKKVVKKETKAKKEAKKENVSLADLSGVGEAILESLKIAGIKNINDIIEAKAEGLTQIKGIGEAKAKKIIAEAKKLL